MFQEVLVFKYCQYKLNSDNCQKVILTSPQVEGDQTRRDCAWIPIRYRARPKTGKTTVLTEMAKNVSDDGLPVALFSMEMSNEQLIERMVISEVLSDEMVSGSAYQDI